MEELAFVGPDGELTLRPSIETLTSFFELGPEYWQGGSGSAYIGWIKLRGTGYTTLFDRPVLHVVVHDPYGVCLMHEVVSNQHGAARAALLTYNEFPPPDVLVRHFIGGEPAYFPGRSFVSSEAARLAVAAFLQKPQPPPDVMWRRRRELVFDGYGYADGE